MTPKENVNYGDRGLRCGITQGKPISQYTLDGELVDTYFSCSEAAKQTGFNLNGIIRSANRAKQYYGYK